MNYLIRLFVVLSVLLGSFSLVSAGVVCCYTGEGVYPRSEGNCKGSDGFVSFTLGDDLQTREECIELAQNGRVSCKKGIKTFCDFNGKSIFNTDSVKSLFGECDSFVPYDSSACVSGGGVVDPGDGGDGSGDGSSGDGSEDDLSPSELANFNKGCSNGGGFKYFFNAKEACEGVDLPGDQNYCVFNSYLAGNLKSYFVGGDSFSLKDFEASACVVNRALKSCFDLKNKDLCENNNLQNLQGNCKWVAPDEFSVDVKALGYCADKRVSEDVYFNKKFYAFGGNLLKNSDFESGGMGVWSVSTGEVVVDAKKSYFGNGFVKLGVGGVLEQELEGVAKGYSYDLSFGMMSLSSNLSGSLKVFIEGVLLKTIPLGALDENFYSIYQDFTVSRLINSSDFSIKFEFEGNGGEEVALDAVSFKVSEVSNPLSLGGDVYSPVGILNSKASNCELCFDDLGMNLCTAEKSDLLGDCAYMVSNATEIYGTNLDMVDYVGRDANGLLNKPWVSQSIANSKVFCELYGSSDVCEDPKNFVNSVFGLFHPNVDGTLCKWHNDLGCFKDSDGHDDFDTLDNKIKLVGGESNYYKFGDPSKYAFVPMPSSELGVSDFDLGCDLLPPSFYVGFRGINVDGESVFIGINDGGELVGNVSMNLNVYDAILESCADYSFDNKLILEYLFSDGDYFVNTYTSNQFVEGPIDLKNFFLRAGENYLDGVDSVNITVKDQSGNIGKTWNFDLNIDVFGPKIELLSPASSYGTVVDTISLNPVFSFKISDESKVRSCKFELSSSSADPIFYNSTGNFSFIPASGVEVDVELPIYNSSVSGDAYILEVSCDDLFGQETVEEYLFYLDGSTDLVVLNPKGFFTKELDFGFLNNLTDVVLISSERYLDGCRFEGFNNLDSASRLEILDFDETVHSDLVLGRDHSEIKKIILGKIGFTVDGVYEGDFVCKDNSGNEVFKRVKYYYDTEKPTVSKFSLEGESSSIFNDVSGKSYMRAGDSNLISIVGNLTADGTGTWIDSNVVVGLKVADGNILEVSNVNSDYGANFINSSFVSSLRVPLTFDSNIYSGKEVTGEDGLRKFDLIMNVSDKAGNSEGLPVSFYVDYSKPDLKFTGDVVDINSADNLIFTRFEDPTFNVGFKAPSYRTFSCSVVLSRGAVKTPKKFFSKVFDFSFVLSDLDAQGWFKNFKKVNMDIECFDVYGEVFTRNLVLHYDDTPLNFESLDLTNGDEVFSKLMSNYANFEDSMELSFNETFEMGGYLCKYKLTSLGDDYNCLTDFVDLPHFTTVDYVSNKINFVVGSAGEGRSPVCMRTSSFTNKEILAFRAGEDLSTSLKLDVECMDGAGFTDSKSLEIDYGYLSDGLIDFKVVGVSEGYVKFVVRSFVPYGKISISRFMDGSSAIMDLTRSVESNGIYVFESLPYATGSLNEGVAKIYAVAFENGFFDGVLEANWYIDHVNPGGNLTVYDLTDDNEVFLDVFKLGLEASDVGSGLQSVELFEGGSSLIKFEVGEDVVISEDSVLDVVVSDVTSLNFFTLEKEFLSNVIVSGAVLGESYNFKMVVTDKSGRKFEQDVLVKYLDRFILTLEDSFDSIVFDSGYGWLTKVSSPTVKFSTSKLVDCRMSAGSLEVLNSKNDRFTVDLKSFSEFDLRELGEEVLMDIVCTDSISGGVYSFKRTLALNDKLVDYVLIPDFAFVVNERPFIKGAIIRSVGVFSDLVCKYSLNSGDNVNVGSLVKGMRAIDINFSGFDSGLVDLRLKCEDKLGNFGPTKVYSFNVSKDADLVLDENSLKLVDLDGFESKLVDSQNFYVHSSSNVGLSFSLNKQKVSCKYGVNEESGLLDSVVNFFGDLFGSEKYDLIALSPYQFGINGLSFVEGKSVLDIECEDTTGKSFKKSYSVFYENNVVGLNVSRIAE